MIRFKHSGTWRILLQQVRLALTLRNCRLAVLNALISGLIAEGLCLYDRYSGNPVFQTVPIISSMYSAFTWVLGILIAFRTSQAFARFWEGTSLVHKMMGDWFNAASGAVAFTHGSKQPHEDVERFKHTLVRLISMLNAMIFAELEGKEETEIPNAYKFDLIDVEGIDKVTLRSLATEKNRAEMVFHHIQTLLVENINTGVLSVPAPLVTRAFQDLGLGFQKYQESIKLAEVPVPFPYTSTLQMVLALFTVFTPVAMVSWTKGWSGVAAVSAMLPVFILRNLILIAEELDNPFEQDLNDLEVAEMQRQLNDRLLTLISPSSRRAPAAERSLPALVSHCRIGASRTSRRSRKSAAGNFQAMMLRRRSAQASAPAGPSEAGKRCSEMVDVASIAESGSAPKADTWLVPDCHEGAWAPLPKNGLDPEATEGGDQIKRPERVVLPVSPLQALPSSPASSSVGDRNTDHRHRHDDGAYSDSTPGTLLCWSHPAGSTPRPWPALCAQEDLAGDPAVVMFDNDEVLI